MTNDRNYTKTLHMVCVVNLYTNIGSTTQYILTKIESVVTH